MRMYFYGFSQQDVARLLALLCDFGIQIKDQFDCGTLYLWIHVPYLH